MNSFDLSKVHELLSFRNLFPSDAEYMREAGRLPFIKLEEDPLYVLNFKSDILFTPKLHYYKKVVENEINSHINEAKALIDKDGSKELSKFILKKTRESAKTLMNNANDELAYIDTGGCGWKNITSDNPIISEFTKGVLEEIVFMHLVIAELSRCWLELQDRYAQICCDDDVYTLSLIYTSILNRVPDKEIDVKRTDKIIGITNNVEDETEKNDDTELIDNLVDIFYNDRNAAVNYLAKIRTMSKNPEKVTYTAGLVNEGKISDFSCRRNLWKLLHDSGLYPPQEGTWNKQIGNTVKTK